MRTRRLLRRPVRLSTAVAFVAIVAHAPLLGSCSDADESAMSSTHRRSAVLPFFQTPNMIPLTRSIACAARSSAAALRTFLPPPLPASAPARARPICMSAKKSDGGGDGNDCDSPQMKGLVDTLLGLVVRPAFARDAGSDTKTTDDLKKLVPQDGIAGPPELTLRYPAVDRIVAIGDVHGDMRAFRKSLVAAGVVDQDGEWAGGKTVLVQVGDQLDRGDEEREIYDTLFRLQDTAPAHGGAVHILLGNHELINIEQDFRYVTEGGFTDFERNGGVTPLPRTSKLRIPPPYQKGIKALPKSMQARARALSPGGPLAVELARRAQVAVIVGDNVFVHGGLSPTHLMYGGKPPSAALRTLAGINEDCRDYMLGVGKRPMVLRGGSSPVWMRNYSSPNVRPGSDACRMLADTLKMLRARRMIVGHTPQDRGINAACGGKVWRIDTGMSSVYGGVPEAIEISKRGDVKIFNPSEGVILGSARAR